MENIDYDDLKKRGFLKQKQEGFFVLRTRMPAPGAYTSIQLKKLAAIAEKYGEGILHATVRQGLEAPFIKFADIAKVEKEIASAGIAAGTSGPRLRATTVCPGSNWCRQGLINTFSLADKIEQGLNLKCGLDLPHKFKIAISGCPNGCTRPQVAEIGVHGAIDAVDKKTGYIVYLGGCGGRQPRGGFRLEPVFSESEALLILAKVVTFYKKQAKPRQRLGALIEEMGKDKFLGILKEGGV